MTLEQAQLRVVEGREAEFEEAFREASAIISSMPGFRLLRLERCVEDRSQYLLLVEWNHLEDHTEGFRGSVEYTKWKELLHHFYDPFPTVHHYERVLARSAGAGRANFRQRVVIVSGAIGVGKSSAALVMRKALRGLVEEVAVLESDDFYRMIDPDWAQPPAERERYHEVSGWLLSQTALGYLRFGFDWVVIATNGAWEESHARRFAERFKEASAAVHHVTLDPGDDEVSVRTAQGAQLTASALDAQAASEPVRMLRQVRSAAGPWTHVIDNSKLTPTETAVAIYEAVERGAGVM